MCSTMTLYLVTKEKFYERTNQRDPLRIGVFMTNNAINSVLYNVDQRADTSAEEKATARANIGAQGELVAGPNIDLYGNILSTEKAKVEAGTNVSVNSVLDNVTRTVTYTVSATDTTYNVFTTSDNGLVPKASGTGDTGKYLKGDGTWATPTDTTYNVFNTTTDGLVPKASGTGETGKYLKGDGTWATPTDTTYNVFSTTADGLVPKANGTGDTGKFLKGDGTWDNPAGASTVKKLDYGESSASVVSTLLIDSDDADGYAILKCDNSNKGYLVVGPYKGLLDSGINGGSGIGDSSTPVYIDGNGQFATCSITPGGAKRSHTAELYFHHSQDGDHYNVRNVKNYCINHVAVTGHLGDICYIEIEAPTLDGTGEEYDYVVVFDCTNSSGGTSHVTVQNADPEIFTYPLDTQAHVVNMTQTMVYFDGSVKSQVEVLGGRFTVHSY